MRLSLLSLGVLVSVLGCSSSAQLSSASGGTAGKSGSGGAAGSAGSPASGGTGGVATGGAGGVGTAGQGGGQGVDAGSACHWGHPDPCGSGMFCNATGCGTGTCMPKLNKTSNQYNPVCGCDGVTYWNPTVAAYFGMAVNTTGACISNMVVCSAGNPCAAGLHCNNRRDQALCAVNSTAGVCWGLPEQCPVDGPKGQPCPVSPGAPTLPCASKCDLIQTETPWYVGSCG